MSQNTGGVEPYCSAGLMGHGGEEPGPTSGTSLLYPPCRDWEQSCWKALVPPPHHSGARLPKTQHLSAAKEFDLG